MSGSYIDIDAEQLCYVRCNNCSTVLAVSVPSNSLFKVVTVKCGHCTDLLWVNLKSLEPQPPLPLTLGQASSSSTNLVLNEKNSPLCEGVNDVAMPSSNARNEESTTGIERAPGKRNRVPSAYNCFIKEEIQRIKAGNPDISHRQAFSKAAKNWALFPYLHHGLAMDDKKQDEM